MTSPTNSVQSCIDFLQPKFNEISLALPNILDQPTSPDNYAGLLGLDYSSFIDDGLSDSLFDELVDVVLVKLLSDNINSLGDSADDSASSALQQSLNHCAVVMDFCFHSRLARKDPSNWKSTFLSLFDLMMNLLSWPSDMSLFWKYPETRSNWFKSDYLSDNEDSQVSTLLSIKAPLSEHLRRWNEFLKKINRNTTFNTPLHYKMKFKLEKFLSNLLSVEEESNYNRSAQISLKQDSSNPWNRKINNSRASTSSEIFTEDYLYLFNKLITNPIGFAFGNFDTKRNVEDALKKMLDALLDVEDMFYKRTKFSHRDVAKINEKINENYYSDYMILSKDEPTYLRNSEPFQKKKEELWLGINNIVNQNNHIPRPTLMSFSTKNPDSFYDQMMKVSNDLHRKEFILQILFVSSLIEKLIETTDVRAFYKNAIEKEFGDLSLDIKRLDDKNIRATASVYNFMCKNRITSFYENRDQVFTSVLKKMIDCDTRYMTAKIHGFKYFNSFNTKCEVTSYDVDASFKKFGFIKLGNKQIDNVWKIKTGLDSIEERFEDPKKVFDNLKNNPIESDVIVGQESPEIVKLWQTLRIIRNKYLFQLENYNEKNGSRGFFDNNLVDQIKEERRDQIASLLAKVKIPHQEELQKARDYAEQKATLKRKAEDIEQDEEHQAKKQILPNDDIVPAVVSGEVEKPSSS